MKRLSVKTHSRCCLVDITPLVREAVRELGLKKGIVQIYVPHTTAGITINEKADPAVPRDILTHLESLVPMQGDYHHSEGNSDAHIKSVLTGASVFIPVEKGDLILGTWQAIFFAEFDGPRNRKALLHTMESKI